MAYATWARRLICACTAMATAAAALTLIAPPGYAAPTVGGASFAVLPAPSTPWAEVNGIGSLLVHWSAPTGGAVPIDHYRVTMLFTADVYLPAAGGCAEPVMATSCSLSGLGVGTTYYFKVTAVDGDGVAGSESNPSSGVMAIGYPFAPGKPIVQTEGARSLWVYWPSPPLWSQAPVDYFIVQYAEAASGTYTDVPEGTCSSPTSANYCTLVNLTVGSQYWIKVRAVNAAGAGNESVASDGVIAIDLPNAPGTPQATIVPGPGATVTWSAPSVVTADAPVTAYLLQSSVEGAAYADVLTGGCSALSSLRTSCGIYALEPGRSTTFRMRAVNGAGVGPPSAESNALTPGASKWADLNGDSRAELIEFDGVGNMLAFRNLNGIGANTYGVPVVIGTGAWKAARTWLADLDGDGRAEAIYIDSAGSVYAFRNVGGVASATYSAGAITIGTGWDPATTAFADINGDGRAEIVHFDTVGNVWAYRNTRGFSASTYAGGATEIGRGWDKKKTFFADLNGDGKSEIININDGALVTAYRNVSGLSRPTFGAGLAIGNGWTAKNTRFADLTGDRKAEISYVSGEVVKVLRNVNGLSGSPFGSSSDVASGFPGFG
jgi:hypothetical protein